MEKQMEKRMENQMETRSLLGYIGIQIAQCWYPNSGESNGKENGKLNGHWDYHGKYWGDSRTVLSKARRNWSNVRL